VPTWRYVVIEDQHDNKTEKDNVMRGGKGFIVTNISRYDSEIRIDLVIDAETAARLMNGPEIPLFPEILVAIRQAAIAIRSGD
jgi:hypothetical protein